MWIYVPTWFLLLVAFGLIASGIIIGVLALRDVPADDENVTIRIEVMK